MAVNPITSESLTIDYKSLMRIPIGNRVSAASMSSDFTQSIMSALTPSQMAQAFPDYYRRQLPDISNFITSNIQNKLSGRGQSWNQTGGGNEGIGRRTYDGSETLDPDTKPKSPQAEETALDRVKKRLRDAGIAYNEFEATGTTVTSSLKNKTGKIISTALTSVPPNKRAFLDTLAVGANVEGKSYWESPSYNAKVYGGTFDSFNDHPRQQRINGSNAAGRYQFLETTWDETVAAYNKKNPDDPITDFSPVNQDKAALFLAEQRYRAYTNGRSLWNDLETMDPGEAIKILGPTWEILQQKTAKEINEAYNINLGRNEEYYEKEREAANIEKIEPDLSSVDPTIIEVVKSNPDIAKFFEQNPELWTQVPTAIEEGKITLDDLKNDINKVVEETAIEAVSSSTNALGFAPGEEETYLGGIGKIGDVSSSGGKGAGSREFGKVWTDPETGKQYPIRGGRGHGGTDLGEDAGFIADKPFKAHMGGEVIAARYEKDYGYILDVKYDDGSIHRYAHNNENIAKGRFEKGKSLFTVGTTGNAATSGWAHVHNEVWMPKIINGRQYTASDLYKMTLGKYSKEDEALLYKSNPRDYWENYEQQQLALREKYVALQERVKEDPTALDSVSQEELKLLTEKGSELYPELAAAASKKISEPEVDLAASLEEEKKKLNSLGEDVPQDEWNAQEEKVKTLEKKLAESSKTETVEAEKPVEQKFLGGNMYGVNEDLTIMDTKTGVPIAQVNNNERLIKQGSALQVTSASKLKADELNDMYDMSDRMDEIETGMEEQSQTQARQVPIPRVENKMMDEDKRWQETVANAQYEQGTQNRAFARIKFLPEGYHHAGYSVPSSRTS